MIIMSPAQASTDPVKEALIFDLLDWLAKGDRTYEDVMDVWRTSCPKLTIWEDATDRGLVAFQQVDGRRFVQPSAAGFAFIEQQTRKSAI